MRFRGFGYTTSGVRPALVGSILALVAGCGGGETVQRDFLAPPPSSFQIPASIVVGPKQPTVFEADSLQLSAVVLNVAQSPVTADIDWWVSGSSGAAISSTGVFRSAGAGAYRVGARVRSNPVLSDSTDITVVSAVLQALTISPRTVVLDAGGTATFTVQAEWNVNAPGLPRPLVDFSATGGTIDDQGRFVAGPVAGVFSVRVRDRKSAKSDSATVNIRALAPASIAVSPSQLTMSPGAVRIFQATATLSDGTTAPAQVTWTATGNGVITPQGFFTAGPTGSGATAQVTATVTGTSLSGTAAVTISQPTATLTSVEVLPGSASLPAGGSQVFTAQGRYSDGSITTLPVTWTATGGTITSVGAYAAGSQAGPFRVVAVAANGSGLADTVPVTVSAATVTGLQVSPGGTTVAPGATQQFTVSATWSDGVSRPAPVVSWTATGGAVTPSGLYTAGSTPGTWAVKASASGVSAQVLVTVSSPPPPASATITSLVVSPGSAVVIAGQSAQFTARATWSDGAVTTPQVDWSATGGSITDGGLYAANLVGGSRKVIARLLGGTLADTAEVTVVAVTQFVLNPGSVSLQAGGTQQFTTSVLWSDGSTSRPVVVLYSASGGTMISNGLYTAGQVAGLFSVIATCNGCGKADTAAVTLTAPTASQPTLTSLAIAPGSVSLTANATRQFTVNATWSDGSNTVPSLSWSVVGIGTVSPSGLYTASSNAGSAQVIARHLASGKADTSSVTITSSAPPPVLAGGGACGNEPSGFTTVSVDDWTSAPPAWPALSPSGWGIRSGAGTKITKATDSSAPTGDSSVLSGLFRKGDPGGSGPFRMDLEFAAPATSVYECIWIKHSANFTDNKNVGTKFGFLLAVLNGGTNHYFGWHGGATDLFTPMLGLQFAGGVPASQSLEGKLGGSRFQTIPLGVWRKYEVLFIGGTSGSPNGSASLWVDGVLVVNKQNTIIFPAGKPAGFAGVTWNPTYGGGLNLVPWDQWMFVDRWYVSVK